MERVLRLSTFEEEQNEKSSLTYWLSRPPAERIAEVERLRREYMMFLRGNQKELPEGLCRTLIVVERKEH